MFSTPQEMKQAIGYEQLEQKQRGKFIEWMYNIHSDLMEEGENYSEIYVLPDPENGPAAVIIRLKMTSGEERTYINGMF
ncbi:MAG: hypothetical protein Q4A78_07700 [Peptostreptococcaceae bacterium]|nr:hypothetical protein [Peptostreptococcaceae bacterium]